MKLTKLNRFFSTAASGIAAIIGAASLFCGGCAYDIVVEEVMQLPEQATLRTAYNIWYTDPEDISTINILKDNIIPFGSTVEIVSATSKKITFRVAGDGRTFQIPYTDKYRMISPEKYLRQLLTFKTVEQMHIGIQPLTYEKIRRGIVERGMTKEEVRLAYGPPCAFLTPDEKSDTWVYWADEMVSRRVVFNNDVVIDVIQF